MAESDDRRRNPSRRTEDWDSLGEAISKHIAHDISEEMKTRFSIPNEQHYQDHMWLEANHVLIERVIQWVDLQIKVEEKKQETALILQRKALEAGMLAIIVASVSGLAMTVSYVATHGKLPP